MRIRHLLGLALASVAALSTGCSASPEAAESSSDEIREGKAAAPGAFPATVLILTEEGLCSGVVIAPEVILTAGHCIVQSPRLVFTGNGAPAETVNDVRPRAAGMIAHEVVDYVRYDDGSRSFTPDIGVVRVRGAAPDLVVTSWSKAPVTVGTRCTIVGFGTHVEGAQRTTGQKREAEVTIADANAVGYAVESVTGIADVGDSGGPLFCDGTVYGTGWSRPNQDEYTRAVYARTDAVANWIEGHVRSWEGSPYFPSVDPPSWYSGE